MLGFRVQGFGLGFRVILGFWLQGVGAGLPNQAWGLGIRGSTLTLILRIPQPQELLPGPK